MDLRDHLETVIEEINITEDKLQWIRIVGDCALIQSLMVHQVKL